MLKYGGNTPCVEVRTGKGNLIIFDCGSGMRELGGALLGAARGAPIEAHVFLTHTHWDHIQGFPFFGPAFIPGNTMRFYAGRAMENRLEAALAGQMEFVYFPITLDRMEADIRYAELGDGEELAYDDFVVRAMAVKHTSYCLAYRVESGGSSVAYVTDVEPGFSTDGARPEEVDPARFPLEHESDARLVAFARGADLLIHDAQLTMEEFLAKRGWGHSPGEFATVVAAAAGARRLALFHHDPTHDDAAVDAKLERCRRLAERLGGPPEVVAAAERMEISL